MIANVLRDVIRLIIIAFCRNINWLMIESIIAKTHQLFYFSNNEKINTMELSFCSLIL